MLYIFTGARRAGSWDARSSCRDVGFAVMLLGAVIGGSAVAAPASRERLFQGNITTKLSASMQAPIVYVVTTSEPQDQTFNWVQIDVAGPAVTGALIIDTSDIATWKPPVKTATQTWTITSKATSSTSAGVYLNGEYRPNGRCSRTRSARCRLATSAR